MRTAELDLASPEGKQAYQQFLRTGVADEVAFWLVHHRVDGSMNAVFEDLVGLRLSTDGQAPRSGKFEMRG